MIVGGWSNWQNSGLIIMYFDCDACQKNYSATASFIIHRRVSHPHLTFINVHCAKTTHYIDTYRLKRTGARDTSGWWPRDVFTVTWYVINFEYEVSLCHPELSQVLHGSRVVLINHRKCVTVYDNDNESCDIDLVGEWIGRMYLLYNI